MKVFAFSLAVIVHQRLREIAKPRETTRKASRVSIRLGLTSTDSVSNQLFPRITRDLIAAKLLGVATTVTVHGPHNSYISFPELRNQNHRLFFDVRLIREPVDIAKVRFSTA